jgi:hypothetical protein
MVTIHPATAVATHRDQYESAPPTLRRIHHHSSIFSININIHRGRLQLSHGQQQQCSSGAFASVHHTTTKKFGNCRHRRTTSS